MRNVLLTLLHLAVMATKLCGPGGVRAVIAENLLLKQQLIVLRRARQRAPNLLRSDRREADELKLHSKRQPHFQQALPLFAWKMIPTWLWFRIAAQRPPPPTVGATIDEIDRVWV